MQKASWKVLCNKQRKKNTCRMAVGWTEPRMVFAISLQAMTHQRHLEEMQADSFAKNWSRSYLQRVKVSGWSKMSESVIISYQNISPVYHHPNPWKDLHTQLPHCCPPPNLMLHSLVEKCRRLNTALQVIKKIKYETENSLVKRDGEREREQQLQLTDYNSPKNTW